MKKFWVTRSWYRLSSLFDYQYFNHCYYISPSSSLSLNTVSIYIEYPCRLCNFKVRNDDDSTQCELCDKWDHIYYMTVKEKIKNYPSRWYHSFYTNKMLLSKTSKNDLKNLDATKPSTSCCGFEPVAVAGNLTT